MTTGTNLFHRCSRCLMLVTEHVLERTCFFALTDCRAMGCKGVFKVKILLLTFSHVTLTRREPSRCLYQRKPWNIDGTWGSTERCMGGVRACWMPPLLKDSERGGSDGSEIRLATLCCRAGELCRFSLERSSTWRTEHVRYSVWNQPHSWTCFCPNSDPN